MQKFFIDRFEGSYAVCETVDRNQQLLESCLLPEGAKEGDCIEIAEDGSILINVEETEKRRKATSNLLKSLLKR